MRQLSDQRQIIGVQPPSANTAQLPQQAAEVITPLTF